MGVAMNIEKGPFRLHHQAKVLSLVVKATILKQVTWKASRYWYLALLNLTHYTEKLEQLEKLRRKK